MYHSEQEISTVFENHKTLFETGVSKPLDNRKRILTKIQTVLKQNEEFLLEAAQKDFHRNGASFKEKELQTIYHQIDFVLSNLSKWTKPQNETISRGSFTDSVVRTMTEPLGCTLVISHWSNPILFALIPTILSLAAGNTVAIVTPPKTPNTSDEICKMINNLVQEDAIYAFAPQDDLAYELITYPFDKIWSITDHKFMQKFESQRANLRGNSTFYQIRKNPVIVTEKAQLDWTAKEIVKSKFENGGQSLLSVSYALVHASIRPQLLQKLIDELEHVFTKRPHRSRHYSRVVDPSMYHDFKNHLHKERIFYGGEFYGNEQLLVPTLIDTPKYSSIFLKHPELTPVLPLIPYSNFSDILNYLRGNERSTYISYFGDNKDDIQAIHQQTSTGSVVINKTYEMEDCIRFPISDPNTPGTLSFSSKRAFESFSSMRTMTEKLDFMNKLKNILIG